MGHLATPFAAVWGILSDNAGTPFAAVSMYYAFNKGGHY
jgi:hypothetical protein